MAASVDDIYYSWQAAGAHGLEAEALARSVAACVWLVHCAAKQAGQAWMPLCLTPVGDVLASCLMGKCSRASDQLRRPGLVWGALVLEGLRLFVGQVSCTAQASPLGTRY